MQFICDTLALYYYYYYFITIVEFSLKHGG